MPSIHLVSDIHLEFIEDTNDIPLPETEGDICLLGGDITTLRPCSIDNFFWYVKELKKRFNSLVYVLGNHEFYGFDYYYCLKTYEELCIELGINLLDIEINGGLLEKDGAKLFGSTLWSDFNEGLYAPWVSKRTNDFRLIESFSINKAFSINAKTTQKIEEISGEVDIILTHFMPIVRKHSRYEIDYLTYGFCCSNLEEIIKQSKIKFWFYGHTHDNVIHNVAQTKLITNQVGYYREKVGLPYNSKLLIEV